MVQEKPPGKNKGGRPPKDSLKRKSKIITLKCSSFDKGDIQARAQELGMSVSEFMVKSALARQFDSPRNYAVPIPKESLLELKGHLGPIGNNLNQLVKSWHNRTRVFTVEEKVEVMTTCQLLKEVLTRLENFLK